MNNGLHCDDAFFIVQLFSRQLLMTYILHMDLTVHYTFTLHATKYIDKED